MLRELKQWVVHRNKVPLNPQTLEPANPHDPSNWLSYDDAVAVGMEVGFVLTADDPYWCLDIDHCREGDGWSPLALELLGYTPGCLVEVSRSGEGLHVWGSGPLPHDRAKRNTRLGIELYDEERFIAWTGNVGSGGSEDTRVDMTHVVETLFPGSDAVANVEWVDEPRGAIPDDETLVKKH